MNRLTDLELARNAPLPVDEQTRNLKRLRDNTPYWSYRPVQKAFPDIFNCGAPLILSPGVATPREGIKANIRRACRPGPELNNNLAVGMALIRFVDRRKVSQAQYQNFRQMYLSQDTGHVTYWLDMVVTIAGIKTVVFIDPRAHNGAPTYSRQLCPNGRRFVLSMMNEHIRNRGRPEFANLRLAVLQRGPSGNFDLFDDVGISLYSPNELEMMADQTISIWRNLHLPAAAAATP